MSVGDDWAVHGMRATGSQTVTLDNVFVPDGAIALSRPRDGFHPVWNVVLTCALPLISAGYVGIADRAEQLVLEMVDASRAHAMTQWSVGELQSQRVVAQTALSAMADLAHDLDFAPSVSRTNEVMILKTAAVTASQRAVEAAMEAVGGRGFYRRNGLERLLRDVRAGGYHPLPEKAQRLFTGQLALGLNPTA